jgi:hypothetical protein
VRSIVKTSRVTRWVYVKKCPKRSPIHFVPKLVHNFYGGKKQPKKLGYFRNFQKNLPTVNGRPIGENSHNLVNLYEQVLRWRNCDNIFCAAKISDCLQSETALTNCEWNVINCSAMLWMKSTIWHTKAQCQNKNKDPTPSNSYFAGAQEISLKLISQPLIIKFYHF